MLESGARFGSYKILDRLGEGGMGAVYRAHDPRLDRVVALKILHPDSNPDEARRRVLHEARSASALNHPYITTVYETGEIDGVAYIAMEYVEGRTLRDAMASGPLPIETVVQCGTQIADALAHAHDAGIIHRDLKARNVVVGARGDVKVLDFGLATRRRADAIDEITRTQSAPVPNTLQGTIEWAQLHDGPGIISIDGGKANNR